MTQTKDIKNLVDATAYDKAGDKLGSVKEVFIDDTNGQPTFVEVNHGLFGLGGSLVPLRGHRLEGDSLKLAFGKDRIKDAPSIDAEKGLTPDEQNRIYSHYDLSSTQDVESYGSGQGLDSGDVAGGRGADTGAGAGEAGLGAAGVGAAGVGAAGAGAGSAAGANDGSNAGRDSADELGVSGDESTGQTTTGAHDDGSVVRSEEQLNVNKDRVETGQARLRKYVVTDTETVEVPVSREEVHVTREPISPDEAANVGGKIGEDEASVTLHEDRVTVDKETVPVEKVSLDKQEVHDKERVSEEVRKEQIETEGLRDDR